MVNELNEKNKLIDMLNNDLVKQNKKAEGKISLLIKDKNLINKKLLLIQKEKEEYKDRISFQINKYINDLNYNQRKIKELYDERNKIIKSKEKSEILNQKLKKIIFQNSLEFEERVNNQKDINKEYDKINKENKEIKNKILYFLKKLELNKAKKSEIKNNIKNSGDKLNNRENNNSGSSSLIINIKKNFNNEFENKDNKDRNKNMNNSLIEKVEKKDKIIQVDIQKINDDKQNNLNLNQKSHVLINNDEINIFNKYINEISTNEKNKIKVFELEKEILLKNEKINLLEEKIKECLKNKESIINKIENEKLELKSLLDMEIQKSLKFKEYADEEKKKHIKYKTKLQQYKRKSKTLEKEIETITTSNNDYYIYKKGEIIDDSKHSFKLREEILKLNQQLDEEKNKSEMLKILAENEKEKIENYKDKYNKTKKFNESLLNKLKEKEKTFNKELEDENIVLKNQIVENRDEIDKLKYEINKLNNEIRSYKKEFKLIDSKEKSIIKENNKLKNHLNAKEDIIRQNTNQLNAINLKYNEEKNKNQRLSLEIKELFYENKRLKDDINIFSKSNKDIIDHEHTPNFKAEKTSSKKKSKFGTMIGFSLDKKKFDKNEDKTKNKKNILKKSVTNLGAQKNVKIISNKSNNESKKDFDVDNFNRRRAYRKSLNIEDGKRSSKQILKFLNGEYMSSSEFSSSEKNSKENKKSANINENISVAERIMEDPTSILSGEEKDEHSEE